MINRDAELERWEDLAKELEPKEELIHSKLSGGAEVILRRTKLLLMKKLLLEIGWPDTELVDDMIAGMPVAGEIPLSHVFAAQDSKATSSISKLMQSCKRERRKLIASMGPAKRADIDEAILAATLKECSEGTMKGPF